MKAFIGLGNPGQKYQNTRHNLGNNIILALCTDRALPCLSLRPKLQASIILCTDRIYAVPHIFMNESGISIQKIVKFYKIKLDHLYLIHDDLDLGVGDYKIQFDRGPAGHKGVASVIQHLGSQQFWRIRLGIGHPPANIPVEDFVLTPFNKEEKQTISQTIDKITQQINNL